MALHIRTSNLRRRTSPPNNWRMALRPSPPRVLHLLIMDTRSFGRAVLPNRALQHSSRWKQQHISQRNATQRNATQRNPTHKTASQCNDDDRCPPLSTNTPPRSQQAFLWSHVGCPSRFQCSAPPSSYAPAPTYILGGTATALGQRPLQLNSVEAQVGRFMRQEIVHRFIRTLDQQPI